MNRGSVRFLALAVWLAVASLATNPAEACRRCRNNRCVTPCRTIVGYKTVERTVQVPKWEQVKHKVQCTEYKLKVVTKHRMVERYKPVTKEVTRTYRKLVYVKKSRVEDYIDYVEDWKTHTVKETVYDRVKVKKKGVRKVCRVKVSKEKLTVCRDLGCYQDREVACCRKGCCTKICRVWVPKIVSEDVMVDVCQNVWVDEPYEWTEIVCKPRVVEKKVKRLHYKRVKKKRTVHWTACETKRITKKVKETHYECVMVKEAYNCATYEPVLVDRVVIRTVCKMVPKKVMCKLPVYGTCASTSSSCCD